jgi:hippurate hydrolase
MNMRNITPCAAHCKPSRFFVLKQAISAVSLTVFLAITGLRAPAAVADVPADLRDWTSAQMPSLTELYQHFHSNPELSLSEKETSARLAKELKAAGATVTTGVGGYGVVGVLKNGDGPTLLIRTDMDALPVAEQTGLPFASTVRTKDEQGAAVGVAHACGHDLHMTNITGVARYLGSHRELWSGTIVFIGQPAEELGSGAKAMLDDGLLARFPRPDFAVALHDAAEMPTGQIGYHAGFSQANVDSVDILVKGRGGHGAYPDTTIDPIVIAARLVLDLQTIVSRETKPTDPAVITVGSIHGGTKHNVIPDDCKLQLTVRSYSPQVREHLLDAIRRKASAAAASSGAPEPEIKVSQGTPSLYNDPELTAKIAATLKRTFGDANVVDSEPTMGGEDFSQIGLAGVPICMFRLGAVNQARLDKYAADHKPPPSLHSPLFYPDAEESLRVGIPAMVAIAVDLLPPSAKSSNATATKE